MPAYNFKKQFAPLVEAGIKRQTIRPPRKRPTRVGDTLYLYTGMRTKQCRKLMEAKCTYIWPIEIVTPTIIYLSGHELFPNERWRLDYEDMLAIASADGFDDIEAMTGFFQQQYGLPFTGEVIRWMPDTVTCADCGDILERRDAYIDRHLSPLSICFYLCVDCHDTRYPGYFME